MSCYREYFKYEIIYFDFRSEPRASRVSARCDRGRLTEPLTLNQSRPLWSCFDVDLGSISSSCWLLVLVAGAAAPPVIRLSLWLSRCAPRLRTGASWRGRAWTGRGSTVLDIRSLLWAWCDSFLARVPVPALARGSHRTPQPRPGEGGEHETSNELQMRTVRVRTTPRGRNGLTHGSYTGLRGGSRD